MQTMYHSGQQCDHMLKKSGARILFRKPEQHKLHLSSRSFFLAYLLLYLLTSRRHFHFRIVPVGSLCGHLQARTRWLLKNKPQNVQESQNRSLFYFKGFSSHRALFCRQQKQILEVSVYDRWETLLYQDVNNPSPCSSFTFDSVLPLFLAVSSTRRVDKINSTCSLKFVRMKLLGFLILVCLVSFFYQ